MRFQLNLLWVFADPLLLRLFPLAGACSMEPPPDPPLLTPVVWLPVGLLLHVPRPHLHRVGELQVKLRRKVRQQS